MILEAFGKYATNEAIQHSGSTLRVKHSDYKEVSIDELKFMLQRSVVEIHFVKASGEYRVMQATLMDDVVPEVHGNSKRSENLLVVWDVENDGWRTIKL